MRKTPIALLPFVLAPGIASLAPAVSLAAWPHDPFVGNVAVSTAVSEQSYPATASDGAGGVIIAWFDYRSGSADIYARRVSAAGVPLWTADGVPICTDPGFETAPLIISDGAGGAVIAWQDDRLGHYDIYAQRVNGSGVPQWAADGVPLCTAANSQDFMGIIPDGAGGAIVSWQDGRGGAGPDIYAQRVNGAGVPQWTANGVAICSHPADQYSQVIASDGAGGAIIAWYDFRSGSSTEIFVQRVNAAGTLQWAADGVALTVGANAYAPAILSDGAGGAIVSWADFRTLSYPQIDIYAQRVNGAGSQQWGSNGVPVCTATELQESSMMISDGAGGAIVVWSDRRSSVSYDIYSQRVSPAGAPLWTADGVAVCTADFQGPVAGVPDGAGGAILGWQDYRSGYSADVYAQRLSAAGSALWNANGAAISTAGGNQAAPTVASDGAGGAIVSWHDNRSDGNNNNIYDIYAQRIERFGQLGNPEPAIARVRDVSNDQGGKVNIQWTASYLDAAPGNPVDEYWIWRQVPAAPKRAAASGDEPFVDARDATGKPRIGSVKTALFGAQATYWEFVGSQPSHGFPEYSFTTSTESDSVAAGHPYTRFMVEAEQIASGLYWGSAPDSGYSVDNLAPAPPAPFTGEYSGGVASLHWGENLEPDFTRYDLHRGITSGFVPGPGNLVISQPDTGYTYVAGQDFYYKLAAFDIHGNRSDFAVLPPQASDGVPGDRLPVQLALGPAQPNPARSGTAFHFALPHAASVTVSLFDPQGRRVRNLVSEFLPAGDHVASWDGRDDKGGRAPSGVYFCRLEAEGKTLTRRLVAVKD